MTTLGTFSRYINTDIKSVKIVAENIEAVIGAASLGELRLRKVHELPEPDVTEEGQLVFLTTDKRVYRSTGTEWVDLDREQAVVEWVDPYTLTLYKEVIPVFPCTSVMVYYDNIIQYNPVLTRTNGRITGVMLPDAEIGHVVTIRTTIHETGGGLGDSIVDNVLAIKTASEAFRDEAQISATAAADAVLVIDATIDDAAATFTEAYLDSATVLLEDYITQGEAAALVSEASESASTAAANKSEVNSLKAEVSAGASEASKIAAGGFASVAEQYKVNAQTFSVQASTSATQSEGHKTVAQTAATVAESHSETALSSANTAESYKNAASVFKTAAENFKNSASDSSVSAEGFKDEAETANSSAQGHKNSAESSSQAAETSKVEAGNFKTSAENFSNQADDAKTSAEQFKDLAQDSQVASENSSTASENSRLASENFSTASEDSSVLSENSNVSSENFSTASENSSVSSENFSTAADDSASLANTYKEAASLSATSAENSDTSCTSSANSSQESATASENSRLASEQARDESVTAKNSSENFSTSSEDSSISAAQSASDANDSKVTSQNNVNTTDDNVLITNADVVTTNQDVLSSNENADRAVLASQAATVNSDTYEDISDGIANTVEGEQFVVVDFARSDLVRYLHDTGSEATELFRAPSSAALDFVTPRVPPGYAWSVADSAGNASIAITDEGVFETKESKSVDGYYENLNTNNFVSVLSSSKQTTIDGNKQLEDSPAGYVWSVMDKDGKAAIAIKEDGTFVINSLKVKEIIGDVLLENITSISLTADTVNTTDIDSTNLSIEKINGVAFNNLVNLEQSPEGYFAAEIVHIFTYGQSLSQGTGSHPIQSDSQPYDTLMFSGGVRPNDESSFNRSSFQPLIETIRGTTTQELNPDNQTLGETPSAGTAIAVKELIQVNNNLSYDEHDYQILMSADGAGGVSISELSDTSAIFYQNLVKSIQAGYDLSMSANKTYHASAMTWTQGESDYADGTDTTTYILAMENLRLQAQGDAVNITGRTEPLKMISYQVGTHKIFTPYPNIALGQVQASLDYEEIFVACPTYQLTYNSDDIHLSAISSKILGFYYGLVYKRVCVDKLPWKPLMPISKSKQGKLALLEFFVPDGVLTFDTDAVTENTNYGFTLLNELGDEVAIESVDIVNRNTIKITSSVTIEAGFKLQYAFYGAGVSGSVNGPRGNLRDTQGDRIVFEENGLNHPAHNWCVMFEEIF
jgi:hypothetical protein